MGLRLLVSYIGFHYAPTDESRSLRESRGRTYDARKKKPT
jgi:hypothetical protein